MNSLKKTTICLLFLCIGVNCVFSEVPEQINFSYISINEGLSQSTVFSIDQDQRGNMWFATYDGVNKYDGYSFTVYQHNEEDPNSIANDISRIVKTDSQGRVWIGTRDGLSYYDEEKDKFRNFFYEKKGKRQQINGIAEISPEQLLISTQEGLTMFDIKESKFVDDSFSTAMHKLIASALYRQGDIIYIGTPVDGLYSYSIPQKKLEKITPITETKQIQAILQQSPTRIWVATEGAGLLLLNPKTKEVKAYHHSSSNPKSISSNYIRSLALDSQNRLWIGTFNDLNIYHEGSDSFVSNINAVESSFEIQKFVREVRSGDYDSFFRRLQSFFADTPYELVRDLELHYQNVLFIVFKLVGFYVKAEYHTSQGRIDLVLQTDKFIYVMEFKLEGTAEEALQQINEKHYAKPFESDGRTLFKIGVNFSAETRNIEKWVTELQ